MASRLVFDNGTIFHLFVLLIFWFYCFRSWLQRCTSVSWAWSSRHSWCTWPRRMLKIVNFLTLPRLCGGEWWVFNIFNMNRNFLCYRIYLGINVYLKNIQKSLRHVCFIREIFLNVFGLLKFVRKNHIIFFIIQNMTWLKKIELFIIIFLQIIKTLFENKNINIT